MFLYLSTEQELTHDNKYLGERTNRCRLVFVTHMGGERRVVLSCLSTDY